jgi:Ca2+-dependent lipid-binding protein
MSKSPLEGHIDVEVINAEGFPEGSDAYVKVYVVRDRKLLPDKKSLLTKTRRAKNEANPVFNHKKRAAVKGKYSNILIQVKDKNPIRKDKPIGEASFAVGELLNGARTFDVPLSGGGVAHVSFNYTAGKTDSSEFPSSSDSE